MRRSIRLAPLAFAAACSLGAIGVVMPAEVVQAAGTPLAQVVLDGGGNGHGVGLSQWGAYGYAVDHGWTAAQILDHYYGGTEASSVPLDSTVRVRLTNLDGAQTAVSVENGELLVEGLAGGPWKSVLVRESPVNGVYSVWARPDTLRCPAASGDPATLRIVPVAPAMLDRQRRNVVHAPLAAGARLVALVQPYGA